MNDPLITVITPVFNGKKVIEDCLKSVIAQDCPHVEHLIMDGASKDGTMDIVRDYASKYSHIRWVSEKDSGQSAAMNKGIRLAKGSIISFLNCDDYYEPGALNTVSGLFADLPNPSFVAGNCRTYHDDGTLWYINTPTLDIVRIMIGGPTNQFPHNPAAYFYHKSLHDKIGLLDEDDHYSMDLDFLLRAIPAAHCVYVNTILGNYRFLIGSKTHIAKEENKLEFNVRYKLNQYLRRMPLHIQCHVRIMRFLYVDRIPYKAARSVKRAVFGPRGLKD